MAEFLIEKGYEVHGIIRRSSSFNTGRIAHLYDDPNSHTEGKMVLHYGDLIDGSCLVKIISEVILFSVKPQGTRAKIKSFNDFFPQHHFQNLVATWLKQSPYILGF